MVTPNSPRFFDRLHIAFFGTTKRVVESTRVSVKPTWEVNHQGIFTQNPYHRLRTNEVPIRDPAIAKPLIEMYNHSVDAGRAVDIAVDSVFSDPEGGVQGPWLADTYGPIDPVTKQRAGVTNPEAVAIGRELLLRMQGNHYIVGGMALKENIAETLFYGDSFRNLIVGREGVRSGDWCIVGSQKLQAWHTFHNTDKFGQTIDYTFYPDDYLSVGGQALRAAGVMHFCHNRCGDYGLSWFFRPIQKWDDLKSAHFSARHASQAAAFSPLIHTLPKDAEYASSGGGEDDKNTTDVRDQYTLWLDNQYRRAQSQGQALTDLTVYNDQEVTRPPNPPDPRRQIFYDQYLRKQFIPAGMPAYNFPDLFPQGKELQGEPAQTHKRLISAIEGTGSSQVIHAINLEICLRKGIDWWEKNAKGTLRIEWPRMMMARGDDDVDEDAIAPPQGEE